MSRRNGQQTADDSLLIRLISRFFFAVAIVLLFLTVVQCTVKKPSSPSWDTQAIVPIVNRVYQMPELIRKINTDYLSIDSLNQVVFSYQSVLDTFGLDADNLTTGDLSYAVSESLGVISIAPPTLAPIAVSLSQIGPLSAVVPGSVPAMTFQVSSDLPDLPTFSSATIAQGLITLTVQNDLGLDLSSVSVLLVDRSNNNILGNQSIPGGLATGASGQVSYDLAGQTIGNQLRVDLDCATAGGSVLSASNKEIATSVDFGSSLEVSSAVAIVDSQAISFSQNVQLIEDDQVTQATIANGFLYVAIENQTALTSAITVSFPDIRSAGQPLSITRTVTGGDTAFVNFPLSGAVIQPIDQVLPQTLLVNVDAVVLGSAPNQVAVDQADRFAVSASLNGISFSLVTAQFTSTTISIDTTSQEIDIPQGFEAISLQSAVLAVTVENAVGLGGTVDLHLSADNGKSLDLSGVILAGPNGTGRTNSFIIDSTVANFLTPLPAMISVSGSAVLGGGGGTATIEAGDDLIATVRIDAPLEVMIAQTTIETDIESTNLDQDDLDQIVDNLTEARLIYSLGNHLPIGTQVDILLSSDSATLLTNPQVSIENLTVTAAPTVGGIATDTSFSGEQAVILSGPELDILKSDSVYIATLITLAGSNGQVIKLTGSDFFMVTARIEIDYRFDGSF